MKTFKQKLDKTLHYVVTDIVSTCCDFTLLLFNNKQHFACRDCACIYYKEKEGKTELLSKKKKAFWNSPKDFAYKFIYFFINCL